MRLRPVRLLALPLFLLSLAPACGSSGGSGGLSPDLGAIPSPVEGEAPGANTSTAPSTPPPASTSCDSLAGLPVRQGDLRAHLRAASISPSGSEGFQTPSGPELLAFQQALEQLLAGNHSGGASELSALGYASSVFLDDEGGSWLLLEDQHPQRGGGTYVLNLAPARELWLEAPHADSDQGTLEQGIEQLISLGARALLITGANRCASSTPSTCGEATTQVCGGSYRISDSAHQLDGFFTAAHRALRNAAPTGVAVSIHGMQQQGNELAVISDGTQKLRPDSLSVRMRDALARRLPAPGRAFSCNDAADKGQHRPLCGTSNVQGRLDNGAAEACSQSAPAATNRFLHLEQGAPLRTAGSPEGYAVMEALAETVPCSLPGNGLGCMPVPPICR